MAEAYAREKERKPKKKGRSGKGYISNELSRSSQGKGLSKRRKEFIERYIPEELKNMTYEELKNRHHERHRR
jgi:hypothetical protein